jgi:hypothetical protein
MRDRAGSATKTGSIAIRDGPGIVAGQPRHRSPRPTPFTSAIYASMTDLHPPWLALPVPRGAQAVLRFVLVLPFHPFTLSAVGFSAGCALIEASTHMAKFIC